MKKFFFSGILISLFLIQACDKNRFYFKFVEIPGDKWNNKNILHFDVPILDTINSHSVYLLVRNTANYKYNNLFLFVTTTSPLGYSIRDTLELTLADQRGKWTGKGAADIFTSQHPYKINVRFPYRGVYSFDIEQALWEKDLMNISDIGLRIDRLP
jgi:gliding motility-associated lipoprotein GldH